jgi:ferrous iron transport protein B
VISLRIALVGNPNVGKSMLFNRITGVGVISSNYPGTTVEIFEGKVICKGETIEVVDLPGTYSLSGTSEDEEVTLRFLAEKGADCVIAVADATRLEQSLVLILQMIEMGFRLVVALNFMDMARVRLEIDIERLSEEIGVPFFPTVAITGEGVDALCDTACLEDVQVSEFKVHYDRHIEEILTHLTPEAEKDSVDFPTRGALLKLLEGNLYFTGQFSEETRAKEKDLTEGFRKQHEETIDVHIGRDRYGEAGRIKSNVVRKIERPPGLKEKISRFTLQPVTGLPLLVLILAGIFLSVVYVGGALEGLILDAYHIIVGNFFQDLADFIGGKAGEALAEGINLSIQAILAIVIPYILVFYLILGVLEDSGYLPRVVVMLDGLMHRIGLHGRAIIPMIVGLGCNVPAILASRVIDSRRERLILAVITVVAIPCSAQTVIIIGTVGHYAGLGYALGIYLILFGLVLVLGRLMNKYMKFEPTSLAIQLPELTIPRAKNVLWKTEIRVSEFFLIAFPLLLAGSIVLEFLMVYGILDNLVEPFTWLTVGLLGLPAVTIIALIFGVLRKEMALQLLVVLFGTTNLALVLDPQQMFVFALVMATFMPCIAAFAVLKSEFGIRDAVKIALGSITIAFTLGTIFNFIFQVFG